MPTLIAIETSTENCSAALLHNGAVIERSEFAPRRRQQLLPRGDGVAPLRLGAIRSLFGHFQPDS